MNKNINKFKFFGIVLIIAAVVSFVFVGCIFDDDFWSDGSLIIKNDTNALPDTITSVTIRLDNSSGIVKYDETVNIKSGESKSYWLDSGTYAVRIRTDMGFEENATVTITNSYTTTLIYDDRGFR